MKNTMNASVEKIVLLELQREYLDICKTFKLKFKPAQIIIFDSETKWGEYDHLARTISLSRKLVLEHQWYNVVGVLKHEVAHQIVSEKDKNSHVSESAHGTEFKNACEEIKLSKKFQSSRLELIEDNKNFDNLKTNEESALIDKVKKLMSLANSDNQHEAKLAAIKVRELYLKYNLEQIGLSNHQYDRSTISFGKKNISIFEKKIISILTEYYFVKAILIHEFNVRKLKTESALEIIGLPENIKMAEYVCHFLKSSAEVAIENKENQLGKKLTIQEKDSFRIGFIDGFSDTLSQEFSVAQKNQDNRLSVDQKNRSQNLQLLKIADAQLNEFFQSCYPKVRQLKSSSRRLSHDQYSAGHVEGKKTKVNNPIENKSTAKLFKINWK